MQTKRRQSDQQPDSLPWNDIDTVLLDMDGTLLDLHYDNHLWNHLLPRWHAAAHNLTEDQSRAALMDYMQQVRGTLQFYCLDHWAAHTGLDMRELHLARTDLICYRPGVKTFLARLRKRDVATRIVTNAHRLSVEVKDHHSSITQQVDQTISCHDYGAAKESQDFWRALHKNHPFDPARTLFIDDNLDVLASAEQFGITHLRAIRYPDSQREAKDVGRFVAADNLATLLS